MERWCIDLFAKTGAFLMVLMMLLSMGAFQAQAAEIPAEYALIADNSRFNLYLREDIMAIILESKASGERMYSSVEDMASAKGNNTWKGMYQSGIVMEYIENEKKSGIQADFVNTPHTIQYAYRKNGFDAAVSFDAIGISFTVILDMDEAGIHVTVPQSSILEKDAKANTLQSLQIFPFLGNTLLGETEGYMLLPDGQGSLIYLEDNEGQFGAPYSKAVYGTRIGVDGITQNEYLTEAEKIIMPVYGVVHTKKQIGFLGVIEEGECGADILAYPNGVRTNYNWICAKFTYRMLYSQPTGPSSGAVDTITDYPRKFDLKLHFLLQDGNDAHYAGLASAWRQYLVENNQVKLADTQKPFDIRLEFVGLEKENMLIGTREVVMTTYQQAWEILSQLYDAGVTGLSVSYRGWQKGGLSGGLPLTGYEPADSLGGNGEMKNLIKNAAERDIDISLEADFLSLNGQENPIYAYQNMKTITTKTLEWKTYGIVYEIMNYLSPGRSLGIAEGTAGEFRREGIENISITGVSSLVTDYHEGGSYIDSASMMQDYRTLAALYADDFRVSMSAPNAYLWQYCSSLYDMPLSDSGYLYVDQEVPFLSIALSGVMPLYSEYVNFQSDYAYCFLQMVEQGMRPSFLMTWEDNQKLKNTNSRNLYSTRYELFQDLLIDWYEQLHAVHEQLAGASIIGHRADGNLRRVQWDNGVIIYLNYGELASVMDGVEIPAMSYKVVNGDE